LTFESSVDGEFGSLPCCENAQRPSAPSCPARRSSRNRGWSQPGHCLPAAPGTTLPSVGHTVVNYEKSQGSGNLKSEWQVLDVLEAWRGQQPRDFDRLENEWGYSTAKTVDRPHASQKGLLSGAARMASMCISPK
jgi:hypothetical protein